MTAVDFRDGGYDDGYAAHDQFRGRAHGESHDHDVRYGWHAESDPAPMAAAVGGMAGRMARLLNYVGALVSVALMIGLLVWGYRLVTRDVSGVPVIRAMTGEARVAPDDPGGELAEGRGLAVNAVPAGDRAAAPRDVAMAPEAAGLTAEDVAMGELGVAARAPGALAEVAPAEATAPVLALTDSESRAADAAREAERLAAEQQAAALAAVAAIPESTEEPAVEAPVDSAVTDLTGAPGATDPITAALAEAGAPAPVADVRPQRRPQRFAVVADPAPQAAPAAEVPVVRLAAAEAATIEDKPADKPATAPMAEEPAKAAAKPAAGSTVVQIGAFDSDKLARGEWDRVSGKNGGLFAGKDQVVQKTQRNGRTFWRLRVAGFGSRDEARDFCAKLKASGTDCIPTSAN